MHSLNEKLRRYLLERHMKEDLYQCAKRCGVSDNSLRPFATSQRRTLTLKTAAPVIREMLQDEQNWEEFKRWVKDEQ